VRRGAGGNAVGPRDRLENDHESRPASALCGAFHTVTATCRNFQRARKRFFEHIRTITAYLVFPDWRTLMTNLINSKPPPKSKNRSLAGSRKTGEVKIAESRRGMLQMSNVGVINFRCFGASKWCGAHAFAGLDLSGGHRKETLDGSVAWDMPFMGV
jgi:hypothetical protein